MSRNSHQKSAECALGLKPAPKGRVFHEDIPPAHDPALGAPGPGRGALLRLRRRGRRHGPWVPEVHHDGGDVIDDAILLHQPALVGLVDELAGDEVGFRG